MHPSVYKNRYFCVLNSDAISFSLPLHIFFAVVLPLLLIPLLPSLSAKPMTAAMKTTAGGGALPSAGREGGTQRRTRGRRQTAATQSCWCGPAKQWRPGEAMRRRGCGSRPCGSYALLDGGGARPGGGVAQPGGGGAPVRWWGAAARRRCAALRGESRRPAGGRPCGGCAFPFFFFVLLPFFSPLMAPVAMSTVGAAWQPMAVRRDRPGADVVGGSARLHMLRPGQRPCGGVDTGVCVNTTLMLSACFFSSSSSLSYPASAFMARSTVRVRLSATHGGTSIGCDLGAVLVRSTSSWCSLVAAVARVAARCTPARSASSVRRRCDLAAVVSRRSGSRPWRVAGTLMPCLPTAVSTDRHMPATPSLLRWISSGTAKMERE